MDSQTDEEALKAMLEKFYQVRREDLPYFFAEGVTAQEFNKLVDYDMWFPKFDWVPTHENEQGVQLGRVYLLELAEAKEFDGLRRFHQGLYFFPKGHAQGNGIHCMDSPSETIVT